MIIEQFRIEIPTWKKGVWTETVFESKESFRDFVLSTFREPGKYGFDETAFLFNEHARYFDKHGYYCKHARNSSEFIEYWETEKKKSINGVIFETDSNCWYLPRDWYFWINFLKIYDKIKKGYFFAIPMDVQLHLALYEILAELHDKHASVFKKRQIASSYFHAAKLINRFWFDEGAILKMGASLKDYINIKGTWKFLEEYRDYLNEHTAWIRPTNPGSVLNWEQKIEKTEGGRKISVGLKSRLTGMSFEQSPTNGVGGACSIFFHEEAGVAGDMDKTYIYIKSALEAGMLTTGLFIAAGSVGELKDAQTLKEFTLNPIPNGIYAVDTDLLDETGKRSKTGLFIPEQWGMFPYVDDYGNSQVEEALVALEKKFETLKSNLRPDQYQLEVSQHPRNIKEGFAFREDSKFPQHLVAEQKERIIDKTYGYELIDLQENKKGEIVAKTTNKAPISTFPVDAKLSDKSGSIQVWERPDPDAPWGTYLGSIDPVSEGKTTTSVSLCSIYIYKNAVEVTRMNPEGIPERFIEGDKIVASWCGRFDDINDTHKRLELLIRWYKAWTIVENNVSLFIQHMIRERYQKFLVPKNQMLFLKEAQANKNVYQEYGWKNTGTLFKDHLLIYLIEFLKEVIDEETDEEGNVLMKFYGIERIPDLMAMVEMENYQDGVNVDRLVTLAALIAFVVIYKSNYQPKLSILATDKEFESDPNLFILTKNPFKRIGKNSSSDQKFKKAFRNIR